jgi:hypothetical protein
MQKNMIRFGPRHPNNLFLMGTLARLGRHVQTTADKAKVGQEQE